MYPPPLPSISYHSICTANILSYQTPFSLPGDHHPPSGIYTPPLFSPSLYLVVVEERPSTALPTPKNPHEAKSLVSAAAVDLPPPPRLSSLNTTPPSTRTPPTATSTASPPPKFNVSKNSSPTNPSITKTVSPTQKLNISQRKQNGNMAFPFRTNPLDYLPSHQHPHFPTSPISARNLLVPKKGYKKPLNRRSGNSRRGG